MLQRQRVVILSAELSENSDKRNVMCSENLELCLQDCNFKYKNATGVYKGHKENSFVVIVNNNEDIETLKDFAFKNFNQESILETDIKGNAYLTYQDNTSKLLGRLEQTSKDIATNMDNYTIMDGKYYSTFKR